MRPKQIKAEPGSFHTTCYKDLGPAKPEAEIFSDMGTKYSFFKIGLVLQNSKYGLRVPAN